MPRQEDRIAGSKLRDLRCFERLGKARVAREVRRFQIHQRQRRRIVYGSNVQIRHLLGREQHKAAPSGENTGQIMIPVMMNLGAHPAAQPQQRRNPG